MSTPFNDRADFGELLAAAREALQAFARRSDFTNSMQLAFGTGIDTDRLMAAWLAGEFGVEFGTSVLPGKVLGGALGAYADGTIYLAEEFLRASDPEAISRVFLEEFGHAIDAAFNSADTAGDEGAIFAALVRGDDLSAQQLVALQAEDDTLEFEVGGEIVVAEAANFSVNTTADTPDAAPGDGVAADANGLTSLRAALEEANALAGDENIDFSGLEPGSTIALSGGELLISDDLTLDGDLDGDGTGDITVDAQGLSRVFKIDDGNLTQRVVAISGLTISGGNAQPDPLDPEDEGDGGGIYNAEILALTNVTISDNSAASFGGGILSDEYSALVVVDSTITGNIAGDPNNPGAGGGIANGGIATTIFNSTIAYNTTFGIVLPSPDDDSTGYYGGGGGIANGGTLALINSDVLYNSAERYGGGILNYTLEPDDGEPLILASLIVESSTISGNIAGESDSAYGGGGGVVSGDNSTLSISNSTISSNTAYGNYNYGGDYSYIGGGGGGVVSAGIANITASTISGNYAQTVGGGFLSYSYDDDDSYPTISNITNSTIAGNTAGSAGGGLINDGTVYLTNSTIALNAITAIGGYGAGIISLTEYDSTTGAGLPLTSITSSIVAGNLGTDVELFADDTGTATNTFTSGGNNLIGTSQTDSILNTLDPFEQAGDLTNNTAPGLDPDGLQDNGGLTPTIALEANSPAIDAGSNPNNLPLDQRGFLRTSAEDTDIGAFEVQATVVAPEAIEVNNPVDEADNDVTDGDASLRDALAAIAPGGTITFASSLNDSTLFLDLGELLVDRSVTIDGGTTGVTIDAGGGSRIFNIDDGDTATDAVVEISGLTLTGGFVTGNGGGILNQENLAASNSTITGNIAVAADDGDGDGGGIYNAFGATLTVSNSTLSGNTATSDGGAIRNFTNSDLTVSNSTITGNSADSGGGIFGAFYTAESSITVTSTIVAGNTAIVDPDLNAPYSGSLSTFIVTNSAIQVGSGDLANGVDGNIVGIDPLLDPDGLQDNGGPTPTIALLPGSPAIDAGSNPDNLPTDQRGLPRLQGDGVDIGAFETEEVAGSAPVAADDTAVTSEATPVTIAILSNDTDADGNDTIDPTTVIISAPPQAGNVELVSDGTVIYTPEAGFTSFDIFTYTVADIDGNLSNEATVTVEVLPDATIPVVADDTSAAAAGVPVVIDVLSNDTDDTDFSSATIAIVAPAANGNATVNPDGTITYTPDIGFAGLDTFAYTVTDIDGNVSEPATVSVTVENNDFLVVDTLVDENDGIDIGNVSLRDALAAVSPGGTITFDSTLLSADEGLGVGVIGLTFGELVVDTSVSIEGDIDGDGTGDIIVDAQSLSRVFNIDDGDSGNVAVVNLAGLTITGGVASGLGTDGNGGGILNTENLTLTDSTLSGNSADDNGGGILNDGTTNINNSTLSDNSALVGGGISNPLGIVSISNSTLSGNFADSNGGGIFNFLPGTVGIGNSTLSGNSANDGGGGIFNDDGTASISNSTLSGNSANDGGGIYNFFGTASISNTIAAGNVANDGSEIFDSSGAIAADANNLFGDSSQTNADAFSGFTPGPNDITATSDGTDPTALGAILDSAGLQDNGGPTQTIALVVSSPAIGAGDNTLVPPDTFDLDGDGNDTEPVPFDQRGDGFDRIVGTAVDIGAFETEVAGSAPVAVDDTAVTPEATPVTIAILSNDTDADGDDTIDPTTVIISAPPQAGNVELVSDGTVIYTPEAGFTSFDIFTYTVADIDGNLSNEATVTVEVLADATIPVVADDTSAAAAGVPVVIDVLSNDTDDTDFSSAIIAIVAPATNGSATVNPDGTITYTPDVGFAGSDTFAYTVTDIDGNVSEPATVTVTVEDDGFLVVDTLVDENDGIDIGNVSLRDALAAVAPGGTITFDSTLLSADEGLGTGVIGLTFDELVVDTSVTIQGDIDGDGTGDITVDAQDLSRVFNIDDGDSGNVAVVAISGLTVTGGTTAEDGGGILNQESLTLTNSTVELNNAFTGGGVAILGSSAQLSIENSTIAGNTSTYGGGVASDSSYGDSITITSSTISGNTAFSGGGIFIGFGTISDLINTTVTDNYAQIYSAYGNGSGGGIFNNGTLSLSNSTVTGNSAAESGGGIYNYSGEGSGILDLVSTLVAANTASADPDLSSLEIASAVNSLIQVENGAVVDGVDGNIVGVDPFLGAEPVLADNGGPTLTVALPDGSPAIDAGSNPLALVFDQRGDGFLRTSGEATDIGAFEVQVVVVAPEAIEVDILIDEDDGNLAPGDVSLREALEAVTPGGTVTFAPGLTGTIALDAELGELVISQSLTLDGTGSNITVDAVGNSRVFNIDDGNPEIIAAVEISGLTITGGTASDGGGILNQENLTLANSTLSGNSASTGGGISNIGGLTITNSTLSGNSSEVNGGAISNYGTADLSNSTISQNASTYGGAILNFAGTAFGQAFDGALALSNSTVSDNISTIGGAVNNAGGDVSLVSTIVADNFAIFSSGESDEFAVNSDVTAEDLVTALLGPGVAISNISLTGADVAGGTFNGGSVAGLGIEAGVILATGNITNALPPNDSSGEGDSLGQPGDPILDAILNDPAQDTNDAVVLEFDVVASDSELSFNYIFASEEYNEFVGSNFNDIFDFSISNPDGSDQRSVALIPGSEVPVSINNVNNETNSSFFVDNTSGNFGIEYDGFTVQLTATAAVTPGEPQTLRLAIADAGDSILDSAVLIEAGSLSAPSDVDLSSGPFNLPTTGLGDITAEFSLVENGTISTDLGNNLIDVEPLLGPLQDNGGPTQTIGLLPGSPALNAGSNPDGLTTDQRGEGFPRTINGQTDIGAFEAPNLPPIVTPASFTVSEESPSGTVVGEVIATDELGGLSFEIVGGNPDPNQDETPLFSITSVDPGMGVITVVDAEDLLLVVGQVVTLQVTATDEAGLVSSPPTEIDIAIGSPLDLDGVGGLDPFIDIFNLFAVAVGAPQAIQVSPAASAAGSTLTSIFNNATDLLSDPEFPLDLDGVDGIEPYIDIVNLFRGAVGTPDDIFVSPAAASAGETQQSIFDAANELISGNITAESPVSAPVLGNALQQAFFESAGVEEYHLEPNIIAPEGSIAFYGDLLTSPEVYKFAVENAEDPLTYSLAGGGGAFEIDEDGTLSVVDPESLEPGQANNVLLTVNSRHRSASVLATIESLAGPNLYTTPALESASSFAELSGVNLGASLPNNPDLNYLLASSTGSALLDRISETLAQDPAARDAVAEALGLVESAL